MIPGRGIEQGEDKHPDSISPVAGPASLHASRSEHGGPESGERRVLPPAIMDSSTLSPLDTHLLMEWLHNYYLCLTRLLD